MATTAMQPITTASVQKAAAELAAMKRSLTAWLKYRAINDAVLAGQHPVKVPPGIAQRFIVASRDAALESDLATRLYTLLSELGIGNLPRDAVSLAQIAVAPPPPAQAMGNVGATHPWLWPVLIVGGLLLGVTTAVKTVADVAKEKEHYACIQSGACTDYGFWLKAGGVTVLAWFAWKELGLGDVIKRLFKKGGR